MPSFILKNSRISIDNFNFHNPARKFSNWKVFKNICQSYEMVTNRGMTRRRPWSKICSPISSSFWLMQAQRPESLAFALLISISAERKYAIYQLHSIKYIWEGSSTQGPLKKWTEHSQELHLLKIHSKGGSYYTPGLDGGLIFWTMNFYNPKKFISRSF